MPNHVLEKITVFFRSNNFIFFLLLNKKCFIYNGLYIHHVSTSDQFIVSIAIWLNNSTVFLKNQGKQLIQILQCTLSTIRLSFFAIIAVFKPLVKFFGFLFRKCTFFCLLHIFNFFLSFLFLCNIM